jgi:DNA-binding MarR family transcriptional regulator
MAVALSDRMLTSLGELDTRAAALVLLAQQPDQRIEELRGALTLSHSGTVRLVDGLERDQLVERRPGLDRRSVALRLTPAGRARAKRVLAARERALADLVAELDGSERDALERLSCRLLERLADSDVAARRLCRLCDEDACDLTRCPVEQAIAPGRAELAPG